MKLPQLARHIKTKHPEHEDQLLNFFQWFKLMQCSNQHFTRLNVNWLAGRGLLFKSEKKSQKTQKAQSVSQKETLAPPAMVKMARIVHRKQQDDKVKCFPLSANILGICIGNIAEDLKKQVFKQIAQCGRFAV